MPSSCPKTGADEWSHASTGSGEEGATLWERRGSVSALSPLVTSPQRQSPTQRSSQPSGPPSLSSMPGTARDAPATPAWFGGDFVGDLVTSINSPPSSSGSPRVLERLERLEADALDLASRSPSPVRIGRMPRRQHWPSAPAQPFPGAIQIPYTGAAIGETLTGLRRASLQLGVEAAAETAAREHAVVGRRRASVAHIKVGVLREYDAAKMARERYKRVAPAREALFLQASPEHDKARRMRTAERARMAAERAAREEAEAAEANRRHALTAERESGLQLAISMAAGGAERAAVDRAKRTQERWARLKNERGGTFGEEATARAKRQEEQLMRMSVNSVGSTVLRVARAVEAVEQGAAEEWASVMLQEEVVADDAILFEPRVSAESDGEASDDPGASDGPMVSLGAFGLGAVGRKVHAGVKLQEQVSKARQKADPSESRQPMPEPHTVPAGKAAGALAGSLAQAAPTSHAEVGGGHVAAEVGGGTVAAERPQGDDAWYQWARLPTVASGARQGTAGDEERAVLIDPLLAPALRTAKRKVTIGRSTAQRSMSESVVELAIEKYGDPTEKTGTWIGGPGVDWGIYQDQALWLYLLWLYLLWLCLLWAPPSSSTWTRYLGGVSWDNTRSKTPPSPQRHKLTRASLWPATSSHPQPSWRAPTSVRAMCLGRGGAESRLPV